MGASRLKKLFGEKQASKSKHSSTSATKTDPKADKADKAKDKAEIARYKQIITNKLKDPAMAKKAAMIIEQMLHEKESDKPNKKAS